MQIFDRKYRLFGVINLIDLVVIVAVLVAAFAVYRVLGRNKDTGAVSAEKDITFSIMVPTTRSIGAAQIKIGDKIYKNTGKQLGTVTGVRVVPTPGEAWDQDSKSIKPYNSVVLSDIYIDCVGKGTPTDSGIAIGDLLVHGYQPMPIMTSTFEADTANIATITIVGQ